MSERVEFSNGLNGTVVYPPSAEDPHYSKGYGVDLGEMDDQFLLNRSALKAALTEPLDQFGAVRFEISAHAMNGIFGSAMNYLSWRPATIGSNPKVMMPHADAGDFLSISINPIFNRTSGGISSFRALNLYKQVFKEMLDNPFFPKRNTLKMLGFLEKEIKSADNIHYSRNRASEVLEYINSTFQPQTFSQHQPPHFNPGHTERFIKALRPRLLESSIVESLNNRSGAGFAVSREDGHFRAKGGQNARMHPAVFML